MASLASISPDLLRYFTAFQSNFDIVSYVCTCTILRRQRNHCFLTQFVEYRFLKRFLRGGLYAAKVCCAASDDILNPELLRRVKEITFYNPCQYPAQLSLPQLPESIQSATVVVVNWFRAFGMLPRTLTRLSFSGFNQHIGVGDLPPQLKVLELGHMFRQQIAPNTLPNSITHLTFGYYFRQPISAQNLPGELIRLTCDAVIDAREGERFILLQDMKHLTHLDLCLKTCSISELGLPKSLTHLDLGADFCGPLDCLPPNVTHIRLGSAFPFDRYPIPDSVQTVQFYHCSSRIRTF